MTYQQTLDYLFTQLPMFQRSGNSAMKKDLTNIRILLSALGNPHEKFRSIHVAGTNGKGTTCHLLAAALQAHGYRVGLYTSPHYRDFRERIKINAEFIPEAEVIRFVQWLQGAELDVQPSFFEITVAMAFDYFASQQPDWVIVEVGLGGRLDSTNVITPELSVITNIGFDHMEFLGDTLPKIAFEKGGIIKPGVPVVIGETQEETTPVFRDLARAGRSQMVFADQTYEIED
ncbi:MAG: Mur ligase family protein, partial [Bacteroidota bacterium]